LLEKAHQNPIPKADAPDGVGLEVAIDLDGRVGGSVGGVEEPAPSLV
jgi:hypothetical protein